MEARELLERYAAGERDFCEADLREADLRGADLNWANLNGAYLREAYLREAYLSGANLSMANLSMADLRGANLSEADLRGANLRGANLSGALGLLNAEQWLCENFATVDKGLLVYKAFDNTHYSQPWIIEEGAIIEEVVNPNPTENCGCGVNFGTLEFVRREFPKSEIRECILLPFVQVVVPYSTDGKARCAKLIVGRVI